MSTGTCDLKNDVCEFLDDKDVLENFKMIILWGMNSDLKIFLLNRLCFLREFYYVAK